jgi:hypothetical protein
MPRGRRQDPAQLLAEFDPWARQLLAQLRADPWHWHARRVETGLEDQDHDGGQLTVRERCAQRCLYWNLKHAPSSGAVIRPAWSLMVGWGPPRYDDHGRRSRMITARVVPREAGRDHYAKQG